MKKEITLGIITFFLILLMAYWFIPFQEVEFSLNSDPSFNLGNVSSEMQFYPNMRFPSKEISYRISEDCILSKKNNMERAFKILENSTILEFYSVEEEEEISIFCEEKSKFSEDSMFIAGEGGPVKILPLKNFNVILKGEVLLLRSVECGFPLVEMHELLHVLGFNHSDNPKNIMYPVVKCNQEIGEEIPLKINELYYYPSLPDLEISEVSAELYGKYLDINISIKNQGLSESGNWKLSILSGSSEIKSFEFEDIKIGNGLSVNYEKIWVPKIKIEELLIVVESSKQELSLDNNQVLLTKIKN